MKRALDIIASAVGLIVLSPLFLFIALRIKQEDGGPVFYRGARVGLNGRDFRIYKFRSMVVDAERQGGPSTSNDDARITTIGRTMRRCKLDELPQLINVFTGDMSLVGPRPEVRRYTDLYTPEEKAILTIRPGITDWASIWNADEGAILADADDPDRAYEELIRPTKLKLQLQYVRQRSFITDLKILFLTALAILRPGSEAIRQIRGHSSSH